MKITANFSATRPRLAAPLAVLSWTTALALTAAAAWLVARLAGEVLGTETFIEQSVQVLGAVIVGLVVYVAAASILHIDEVAMVRRQVVRRFVR